MEFVFSFNLFSISCHIDYCALYWCLIVFVVSVFVIVHGFSLWRPGKRMGCEKEIILPYDYYYNIFLMFFRLFVNVDLFNVYFYSCHIGLL